MHEASITVVFEPKKTGCTRGQVLVHQNSQILYSDVLDIARDKDRRAFLKKLKDSYLAIDTDNIQQLILAEVGRISEQRIKSKSEQNEEVETSRIVRPHLFHMPEVSGLLIPVTKIFDGRPKGFWSLYVQWADGTRECKDLEQYITLPNDERLWFLPKPKPPAANLVAGWSQQGRKKWLEGYTPEAARLFMELTKTFNYYIDFPADEASGHLATLSLWVILTYAYPAWLAVPYLSIGGPLGSGKSRVFDVLGKLAYRPLSTSNMTAPCLFRTLDAQGGTLLLDEAERLRERSSEVGEIKSILLGGYKAGGKAHRLEKRGDSFQSVAFNVYGPKAIAGINELPAALASRCIRITMFKATKNSLKPGRRIDRDPQRWITLIDDLHSFTLAYGRHFVEAGRQMISCEGLNGRDMEVWQPILGLGQLIEDAGAGNLVDLIKRHAIDSVAKVKQDTIPESDEILLCLLMELIEVEPAGVTASQVLAKVKEQEPSMFNYHSPRGVGAVLKRYGIRSRAVGGRRLFRPEHKQLLAIQESYGIDLGLTVVENIEGKI